jgi:hypothetical protein
MAQIFSGLFFILAALGGVALIVTMIRSEWRRIIFILTGAELAATDAAAPRIRIRQRAWGLPELRPAPQRRAVAA